MPGVCFFFYLPDFPCALQLGFWAAASAGYSFGGETTLDGEDHDDYRRNLAWAFSLGCPISRQLALKAVYLGTRSQEKIGMDSDSFILTFSFLW